MENLTLIAKYEGTYNKTTGSKSIQNAYSLHGSPTALATYRADITREIGRVPVFEGTDIIRYTSPNALGDEIVITRNPQSGKWQPDYTMARLLEGELKKATNPIVAQALANAYTQQLTNSFQAMLDAKNNRRSSISAPISTNEPPVPQDGKKVDDVF